MSSSALRRTLLVIGLAGVVPCLVVCAGGAPPAQEKAAPGRATSPPGLPKIDALVKDQKLAEAVTALDAEIAAARTRRDDETLAYALVRKTELQIALGGYETAVRELKSVLWPKAELPNMVLQLYYGHALTTYVRSYGWEIGQREKVETKSAVDLKSWTRDQIVAEAAKSFAQAFAHRDAVGARPVGAIAAYLAPNTYPDNIRGTLRDALTYLAVAQLSDSSLWRADQSNELYKLDLDALLQSGVAPFAIDGDEHPVSKLVSVLDDLEAFHVKAGRPEAALEARLERLRRLHDAFTEARDRRRIEVALEARLATERQRPWWGMGQALLASWAKERGSLVRAHTLAVAGRGAFAGSMGAKACTEIAAAIEQPEYSVSAMGVDGSQKSSIAVQAKNMSALWLRAYAVDLHSRMGVSKNYNMSYDSKEVRGIVAGARPLAEWKVTLPATPDFARHRTHVALPKLPKHGTYLVVTSARADFATSNNHLGAVQIMFSDLVLTMQVRGIAIDVTVLDGPSGRFVPDAEVELWKLDWNRGHRVIEKKRADKNGEVHFTRTGDYTAMVAATKGDDFTLANDNFYVGRNDAPAETHGALVYTDRSVYRPGQKISWKTVAYAGRADQGQLHVDPKKSLTVWLRDANYQEVAKAVVITSGFGSANGEFIIPTGRLLGRWSIHTSIGGDQSITIEEYKRPTFEVTLKPPVKALRVNEEARLAGEARYYFGLPVTAGQVKYVVMREPVYPSWWGWYHRGGRGSPAQTIARGTAPLAADGSFQVKFLPEVKVTSDPKLTYRYNISADVTDEGGETRSASRSYRLGLATVEASVGKAYGFFTAGHAGSLTLRRTDLDSVPRPGPGSWRVVKLAEPEHTPLPVELPRDGMTDGDDADGTTEEAPTVTAGDRRRARFETSYSLEQLLAQRQDGAVSAKADITTDDTGNANITLPVLPAGAYRLRYDTVDDHGVKVDAFADFVVAGAHPLHVPGLLLVEKSEVHVGEKVRVLVECGLDEQTVLLDTFRAGVRVSRRVIDGRQGVLELMMTEADRGGLAFAMTLVRDHQVVSAQQSVHVPWDNQSLKLSFSTFRDKLRPGAKETFRITVEGEGTQKGKLADGAAELLAYMYDRSLDLFAPHSPPSPMGLFPYRASAPASYVSLLERPEMLVANDVRSRPSFIAPIADQLLFESGYGIGGMGKNRYVAGARMGFAGSPMRYRAQVEAVDGVNQGDEKKKDVGGIAERSTVNAEPRQADPDAPRETSPLRSNFSETAFFFPSLITNNKGEASFEFTVPDSVTSWNVWVHAITKDLRSGSATQQTRSVKDMMVRPYLPRFFREGDAAELKVVVNNAGTVALDGTLEFDIVDPETQKSRMAAFGAKPSNRPLHVEAGKSADLTFPVTAPHELGTFAIIARAMAKAGNDSFSDGEIRPIPVLPSRLHLTQSRFVTLRDTDKREMRFDDLAKHDDPSRVNEQMVVTLDAQLFYTVLRALPYLVSYPYECAEQTLNRFVSTGIVSSLFAQHPEVAKMASQLSQRKTQLKAWDAGDANRKMGLEEAPFLFEAKGGSDGEDSALVNVLDARIAASNRDSSLEKLKKMQNSTGAFPWFQGGPPNPYMTLYVMHGLAKAAEFKVDVPKDMVQRGWRYLASHYRSEYVNRMVKEECCWEFLTFLNYVASSYPDASFTGDALTKEERNRILAFSFKHWKEHSPYLKGMLALTLKRMGRASDGRKVFDSVMDSAKTARDQGTFWAQEDRSWLWYNDTIESHAFALRVLTELDPQSPKKDGLVLWLLLNKKLNQWKSTRATAEVLYTLAKYMQADGSLGVREAATVAVGPRSQTYTFEPDKFVGKVQMVVPGTEVSDKAASITVEKKTKGVMFASATWSFATDKLPTEGRGDFFTVSRKYFVRENNGREYTLRPIDENVVVKLGDEVEVQLQISTKHEAEYVHLRDPRGAGFEPSSVSSRYKWDMGLGYYEEVRDSGENFFFERLPVGQYTFKYRLRATTGGTYRVGPATLQSMYAPEFNAYSAGHVVKIAGR